jgi:hypothetical protein
MGETVGKDRHHPGIRAEIRDPLKFFTVENRITDNVGLNDKT